MNKGEGPMLYNLGDGPYCFERVWQIKKTGLGGLLGAMNTRLARVRGGLYPRRIERSSIGAVAGKPPELGGEIHGALC
jgi:hypothetical protein